MKSTTVRDARRVPHPAARAARRRRHKQPMKPAEVTRIRKRALMALYCVLVIELAIALVTSPVCAVRRVEVGGIETLPPAEAAQALAAAQLPVGVNWLRAPIDLVLRRERALPFVESARVRRVPLNRLSVRVRPRQAAALLVTDTGAYEIDRYGVPVRAMRREMVGRLPLIALRGRHIVTAGEPLDDPAVQGALTAYDFVRAAPVLHVAKIEVDPEDNLCLNMLDGLPVRLGGPGDLDAKLRLVRSLYRHDPAIATKARAVNLSCPAAPAYTPVAPPNAAQQAAGSNGPNAWVEPPTSRQEVNEHIRR